MKKRILIVVMILVLILGNMAFANSNFSDVSNHWGENYIGRLTNVGIINGYPDGSYKPNSTMTRAEFVTVLIRSLDVEAKETGGKWYEKYLNQAKLKRYIKENNIELALNPEENISRYEVATTFYNLVNELGLEFEKKDTLFNDINSEMVDVISVNTSLGIFGGYPDNTFKPQNNITRAEIATVFSNLYFGKRDNQDNIIEKPLFDDYKEYFTSETIAFLEILNKEEIIEEVEVVESNVPDFLQERFNAIKTEFNFAWTDEDFENWFNSHTREERGKYYDVNKYGAEPKFNFDERTVLITEEQGETYFDLANEKLPVEGYEYLAYEMFKRHIELFVGLEKEYGEAYGDTMDDYVFKIFVMGNPTDRGLKIGINKNSIFQYFPSGDNFSDGTSKYAFYLKSLYDNIHMEFADLKDWNNWTTPYTETMLKMNMYFQFGKVDGEKMFDNYMEAYKWKNYSRYLDENAPKEFKDTNFNISLEKYDVIHSDELGYYIELFKKEK